MEILWVYAPLAFTQQHLETDKRQYFFINGLYRRMENNMENIIEVLINVELSISF